MANPIDAPPVRWFIDKAERRRVAWQYWVRDVFWGLIYRAGHETLRATSIDACSRIGDVFGDFLRRHVGFRVGEMHRYRVHEARARENWTRLRPDDKAPEVVEAAMDRAFRNSGRAFCEFSVLDRLWSAGRLEVVGAEHLAAARAGGRPTLVAGLHLGNWETIAPAMIGLGHGVTGIYQVPPNRFDHRTVIRARARFGGKLVPPGRGGARAAYRVLAEANDVLVVYVDEFVNGRVHAPFFGRPAALGSNLAKAVRFATMARATMIPAYSVRQQGARFRVTFLPPVPLQRSRDHRADLAANVVTLNAIVEPIVRAHLDQWLWLFDIRPES